MYQKKCPVKVKLILHSHFSNNIDMEFQGNVYHDVRKTYVDDIRRIDREELKDGFKKIYLHNLHRCMEKDRTIYQTKFLHRETGKMAVNIQKSFNK